MNIYHCRSLPKVGVGDRGGGGKLKKMLRRWFFKDTSKALPSTAVSKWRWCGGCVLRGGRVGVDFWCLRWHAWWFKAAGRASSTWQQCNKIIRAIRANKNPSNLPQNPDYDSACSLNTKHVWGGLTGAQAFLRHDCVFHIRQLITRTCIRTDNLPKTTQAHINWTCHDQFLKRGIRGLGTGSLLMKWIKLDSGGACWWKHRQYPTMATQSCETNRRVSSHSKQCTSLKKGKNTQCDSFAHMLSLNFSPLPCSGQICKCLCSNNNTHMSFGGNVNKAFC